MENMFEDAEPAFAYKSDNELKKAFWMFRAMGFNQLVGLGTSAILNAIKWKLPVNPILKNTLYNQFVGGETLEKIGRVADKLAAYQVDVILDYGAEAKTGEANFDLTKREFIKAIGYASSRVNVPFVSLKVTALASFGLLEKLNPFFRMNAAGFSMDTTQLTESESREWLNMTDRIFQICEVAMNKQVGVLIDAEESWIQNTIDYITMRAMQMYNQKRVTVFNTIQLYRHDRLAFLKASHAAAGSLGFRLGVKLVRGAYMEKEAARAADRNESSPIQPDKSATDRDYNAALAYCLDHLNEISVIVATHNEFSSLYTTAKLREQHLPANNGKVFFSQLYGMSDNITFGLAKEGYSTSKYLPYGPVSDVIPYLLRRAQENSSVAGQTGREVELLRREMKRRGFTTF
ncbi:proline dehydrogenase family protein [Dyadobacter sp. Leaf189]|uniref:proline dehydrogenase family protein n=1 Tax=Dyadobacter sp. Leaf189 TaxID=1736295 RepID=UPI0006FC7E2B|nr:proline dehydrogenase family protein [Dyadobacter sp. Leaf189]KQS28309.1 proline dehydrogenase [Dyadobacter sp. Leaf189]